MHPLCTPANPIFRGITQQLSFLRASRWLRPALLLLIWIGLTALTSTSVPDQTVIQSFSFSSPGRVQTFVMPGWVTSLNITANGAAGGSVVGNYDRNGQPSPGSGYNQSGNRVPFAAGGKGGKVTATLTVTPGQSLSIYVGGSNGYNGGGSANSNQQDAGTGGGATDIQTGSPLLTGCW